MKVLFSGPSLYGADMGGDGLILRPPARQGDIHRAVLEGANAIGLVDGVFGFVPSVWHKELLFALSEGVRVLGGASLGALRAAECHLYGMEPVGEIAAQYVSGERREDGDVCLVHGPEELGFAPLSEPLVEVEATIAAMMARGALDSSAAKLVLDAARRLHFSERDVDRLFAEAGVPEMAAPYRQHRVPAKRHDALAVVARLRALPDQRGPRPAWEFVASDPWRYYLAELERGGTRDGR